jgi:hypothetical protein
MGNHCLNAGIEMRCFGLLRTHLHCFFPFGLGTIDFCCLYFTLFSVWNDVDVKERAQVALSDCTAYVDCKLMRQPILI